MRAKFMVKIIGVTLCAVVASACGVDKNSGGAGGVSGGGAAGSGGEPYDGPVPMFPGAGTSNDADPLPGGRVCDSVGGEAPPMIDEGTRCFYTPDDPLNPAATIEQVLECVDGVNAVHLRLTFSPTFNDNTYGANAIGWPTRGGMMGGPGGMMMGGMMMGGMAKPAHSFMDLVGSDHAELLLIDGDGQVAMQFKVDYISQDDSAASGYNSLCVSGGDGAMIIGDAADIIGCSTSLERNFNERGYDQYTTDSPETDANYTPNASAPDWDYRVVFDVWVDPAAFGDAGFEGAFIDSVHASPSKAADNTIETMPGECPPTWDPCLDENPDTYCVEPPIDDPCRDDKPDTYCADGSEPNDPEPSFCQRYPSDPSCYPE